MKGCFGRGALLIGTGDVVFFKEGVKTGARETCSQTGLFDVSVCQDHEFLEVIMFNHGKCVFLILTEFWKVFRLTDALQKWAIRNVSICMLGLGYFDSDIGG